MQVKKCGSCRKLLPHSDFSFRNRSRGTLQSYCRSCANRAWRTWYSSPENRRRHLQALARRRTRRIRENRALVRALKSMPCSDCGQRFPPEAMDFDHREGKEELVSKLVYQSGRERLIRELIKCDLVCANCHRIRTVRRTAAGSRVSLDPIG